MKIDLNEHELNIFTAVLSKAAGECAGMAEYYARNGDTDGAQGELSMCQVYKDLRDKMTPKKNESAIKLRSIEQIQ